MGPDAEHGSCVGTGRSNKVQVRVTDHRQAWTTGGNFLVLTPIYCINNLIQIPVSRTNKKWMIRPMPWACSVATVVSSCAVEKNTGTQVRKTEICYETNLDYSFSHNAFDRIPNYFDQCTL